MSWGGSGGFFGGAAKVPQVAMSLPGELDALRQFAREAYAKGRLTEAVQAQAAVLSRSRATDTQTADDVLFAGLVHHAAGRIDEGLGILRESANRFPGNTSLQENLGVLLLAAGDLDGAIAASQTALALGSDSPNVQDCLCEAYERAGRPEDAVTAGRLALEAKDRRFGGSEPLVAVPSGPPPAFDPSRPEQNVISYSLWGNQPRYLVPLLENARIRPHLFPAWTIRVYHDRTVDAAVLRQLAGLGVDLRPVWLPSGVPAHRGLLWRFEAIADPSVRRFLIRDADSLLTVKERVAVDAWLASDFHFHAMRDWYTHTDLVLAGMWGGVGGILPQPSTLMRAYTFWRAENDHLDQDLLSETIWPAIRRHVLIHDSIFQPCLGSVPFPPFGSLPPGNHVGQNGFLQFSKTG